MLKRLKNIDFLGLVLWFIRASIIAVVIWGSVATIIQNPYTTRNWIDFIVFGIAQGSMYALIAIGYSLVYGVLFMINFAHGEFFYVRNTHSDCPYRRTFERIRVS